MNTMEVNPIQYYVDSFVTGGLKSIPNDGNNITTIVNEMKRCLVDGLESYTPSRVDEQTLYFDAIYKISPVILYEIYDGINVVYSECEQMDDTSISIKKDISHLTKSNMKIRIATPKNWIYEFVDGVHIFSNGYSSISYFLDGRRQITRDGLKTTLSTGGANSRFADQCWVESKPIDGWSMFVGDDCIIIKHWATNNRWYTSMFISNIYMSYMNGYYYSDYMHMGNIAFSTIYNGYIMNDKTNIAGISNYLGMYGNDNNLSYRKLHYINDVYKNLPIPYINYQIGGGHDKNVKTTPNANNFIKLDDGYYMVVCQQYLPSNNQSMTIFLDRRKFE